MLFHLSTGIRGEVKVNVKVDYFIDSNKFRQSSCGVQFFYSKYNNYWTRFILWNLFCSCYVHFTYKIKIYISSFIFFNPFFFSGNFILDWKFIWPVFLFSACSVPFGHKAVFIHGFVEELVVNDDPEYQWIDKIRTPRSSNEARQRLFTKLSGFWSHLFFYLIFIFLLPIFCICQVKLSFIHSQPMNCNHGDQVPNLSQCCGLSKASLPPFFQSWSSLYFNQCGVQKLKEKTKRERERVHWKSVSQQVLEIVILHIF